MSTVTVVPGLDPQACLQVERDGDVVTVTLDRPDRHNAQTPHTWLGLREVGRALPGDVRIVVVRGAGPSFSSGLDRAVMAAGLVTTEADIVCYQEGFAFLTRPDLISIAAVHGYALGAGCQLALACDLRVAASDAQFALPEPSLGLVPDLGGTHPLVRAVGYSRALEICLTGRRIGAVEAHAIGLANVVVEPQTLSSAVADLVAALLAVPRDAAVETKALLQSAMEQEVAVQRGSERAAQLRRLDDIASSLR